MGNADRAALLGSRQSSAARDARPQLLVAVVVAGFLVVDFLDFLLLAFFELVIDEEPLVGVTFVVTVVVAFAVGVLVVVVLVVVAVCAAIAGVATSAIAATDAISLLMLPPLHRQINAGALGDRIS
jgi:hypothetical protein